MKRVASILLTVIFLSGTVGITLATHYCGGKLFGTRIVTHSDHDPCGCPSSDVNDNCCKDEVRSFKIQDDFVYGSAYSLKAIKLLMSAAFSALPIHSASTVQPASLFFKNISPHSFVTVPIRVLGKSFRI